MVTNNFYLENWVLYVFLYKCAHLAIPAGTPPSAWKQSATLFDHIRSEAVERLAMSRSFNERLPLSVHNYVCRGSEITCPVSHKI